MRGLRFLSATALIALSLSATGCAKLAELKPEPKVVVVAAKVASIDAKLTGKTLAQGRPQSLPLWPGSTVVTSNLAQTPQGKSWTSSFTTPDAYDAVVQGFAAGLEDAGWSAEVSDMSVDSEKTSLITASNDTADALFTITRPVDSSVTLIDVVVTPK